MTRLSAHKMKGGKGGPILQDKPKEGTKLRKFYDLLLSKDIVTTEEIKNIFTTSSDRISTRIQQLENYYELDIVNIRKGYWSATKLKDSI